MSLARFKIAAVPPQPDDEPADSERSHLGRNLLMGGAAALPFAGMIGDTPNIHDGKGLEFKSLDELKKHVTPGDIVISSPHKKTFTTLGVGLGTGVPDATHAAFVDDLGRLISNRTEGNVAGPLIDPFEEGRAFTVLRPKVGGPLNAADMAKKYRRQYDAANALEIEMLKKGLGPKEIGEMRRNFYTKTKGFIRTPLHSVMAPTFGPHGAGDKAKKMFEDFYKKPSAANIENCAGGWCSLPGAMAFPEGMDVRPGRKPGDTTPVDFLKNPHLEAVGGYGRGKNRYVDQMIRAGPTAARLTYGALAALGVYGASKAVDAVTKRFKQPQVAPAPMKAHRDDGKTAAEDDAEESHTGRNVLMGGAMAAPWLGAIGAQRERPSPLAPDAHTFEQLSAMAQPGDVILSGDVNPNSSKSFVSLASSSPKAYHAMLMGRDGHIVESGPDGVRRQPLNTSEYAKDHHLRLLRPKLSPGEIAKQIRGVEGFEKSVQQYADDVGRRTGKLKLPVTGEDLKYYTGAHAYGEADTRTMLREMFVPKLRSADAMNANMAETQAARRALAADPRGAAKNFVGALKGSDYYNSNKFLAKAVGQASKLHKALPTWLQGDAYVPPVEALNAGIPDCARGVCSSMPAQHLPKNKFVVPGKLPQHVLPSDYLKSDLYDTVASHSPKGTALHENVLGHGLTGMRLLTGLAGAGLTYGADKAVRGISQHFKKKKQESPED